MKELLEHARTFQRRIAPDRESFRRFGDGQSPGTLFITCSDSRVVPTLITGARPGELFELRNAGNVVPPYQHGLRSGEAATIEYAVDVLRVRDIVVCGHSHCGAVGALARDENLGALPSVAEWLSQARPALVPLLGTPPDDAVLRKFVQLHVIAQLEALRTYPHVERALAEGRLSLHGWFYRVDTAEVRELDFFQGIFRRH